MKRKHRTFYCRRALAAAAGILLLLAAASPAPGSVFSYAGSLQFAAGSYIFNQTTIGLFLFNGITVSAGGFILSANLPLIFQSTPYISYSGAGMLPSGGSEHSQVSGRRGGRQIILSEPVDVQEFGIGDPLLYVGLRLWKESGFLPSVQVTGQAKAPLASVEQGFGTGEWDCAGGISLSKKAGSVFLFLDLNYWKLGDLPELELKDPLSYSLSVGKPLSGGKYALLVSYSGCTRIISEVEPPSFLGIGFSYRVDSRGSLMVNASFGLSESVPDFTVSLGWTIGL